jgi:hypothetical protein
MVTPEHVANFVSIVVGLALADVAHSLHRLLRAGPRVRWDVLAPMAALLVTASVVNTWWTANLVFAKALTFAGFLPNLASLLTLFLLASATLPDEVPEAGLDLRAYYLGARTYFWGLFILWVCALVFNEALASALNGRTAGEILRAVAGNLAFLPVFALLMWSRRAWVHAVALAFCLVVVVGSWAFDNADARRAGERTAGARAAGAPLPAARP